MILTPSNAEDRRGSSSLGQENFVNFGVRSLFNFSFGALFTLYQLLILMNVDNVTSYQDIKYENNINTAHEMASANEANMYLISTSYII